MTQVAEYDHIVVGGGAGGCVAARRLADAGASVLLLEAGPGDRSPVLRVPGASAFGASAARFNWRYATEPQPALGGRRLHLAQGRVLGGGTSINGMVYTRGFPADYDAWRDDLGCAGWGFADVLPFFRRSEANERGAGERHGGGGPLHVTRARSSLPISARMLAAAAEAGHALTDDFCATDGEGFGYYDFTIAHGRRASAASAFLRGAGPRGRLTIRTGALAQRILIEGVAAVGVEYRHRNRLVRVRARGEIVLAGGAVNTPKLLMLSGIGPAEELRRHGIAVLLDRGEVGRNLQNHLCFKLAYATAQPITAYRYLHPLRGAVEVARYLAGRGGFLAEGSAPVGGFFRSAAGGPIDLQLFAPPAIVGLLGKGARALLPSRHGFTFFVSHGRPASRGTVALAGADAALPPRIDPRYLSEAADLDRLVEGVERMRDLAAQPALAAVVREELVPGPGCASRAAIAAAVRRLATNQYHVAGTCRMGADEAAVVDLVLRVRGVRGLRVADASIMPTLINGNTAAPVMMIGERAADFILAAHGAPA